jgi:hypothetical protein
MKRESTKIVLATPKVILLEVTLIFFRERQKKAKY